MGRSASLKEISLFEQGFLGAVSYTHLEDWRMRQSDWESALKTAESGEKRAEDVYKRQI